MQPHNDGGAAADHAVFINGEWDANEKRVELNMDNQVNVVGNQWLISERSETKMSSRCCPIQLESSDDISVT